MCLTIVSIRKPKPTGFGWKVFRTWTGDPQLYGQVYSPRKVRPVDKWLKEKDYRNPPEQPVFKTADYPIGWHIFKKKKDAKLLASGLIGVYKVEYRKAHAQGKQRHINPSMADPGAFFGCVVAKEMKILPLKLTAAEREFVDRREVNDILLQNI